MTDVADMLEWLDAVGDFIDKGQSLPPHVSLTDCEWVVDGVGEHGYDWVQLGIPVPAPCLWKTDYKRAVRETRSAVRQAADIAIITAGFQECAEAELALLRAIPADATRH